MSVDFQQEKIDEFINGDINERINKKLDDWIQEENKLRKELDSNQLMHRIKEDLYVENWPIEDQEREMQKRLKLATSPVSQDEIDIMKEKIKNDFLEEMKTKREFDKEKHLSDLVSNERELNNNYNKIMDSKMNDMWWNEKKASDAEARIYTDDINGMKPNEVVNHYADIANYFNIKDTVLVEQLLKNCQDGIVDVSAFRGLIENEQGKKELDFIIKKNNGKLSVENLIQSASNIMQTNAQNRIGTAKGYMDVAEKDLDARAKGIEGKLDVLNKTKLTTNERNKEFFNSMDEAYSAIQDVMQKSKASISMDEIKEASKDVKQSNIDSNIKYIKDNIRNRDNVARE